MTSTQIALLVAAVAAVPGALVGFLASARRFSGNIRSTEANTLWNALEKEKANLTARLDAAYTRLDACEAKMAEMEKANNTLVRANIDLNRALLDYEDKINDLNEEKQALEKRVIALQAENAALVARIKEP